MNAPPLVSVVTPSYNQAAFLRQALDSVLSQDYPRVEYLVLDGGSTDGSADVVREYADRLAFWVSEPDAGQAAAIRRGWQLSHGEIIAWLNSDDAYLPGALSAVARAFAAAPTCDVLSGDCIIVDRSGAFVRAAPGAPSGFGLAHLSGNSLPQPGLFFRRAAVEAAGGLDPALRYVMDWDLLLRLWLGGARFQHMPQVLARCRAWPDSKTASNPLGFAVERAQVLAAQIAAGHGDAARRCEMRAARRAALLEVALGYQLQGSLAAAMDYLRQAASEAPPLGPALPRPEGLALRLAACAEPAAAIAAFVAALAAAQQARRLPSHTRSWRDQLHAQTHLVLAWNAAYAGRRPAAIRHFARAIRHSPALLRDRRVLSPALKSVTGALPFRGEPPSRT